MSLTSSAYCTVRGGHPLVQELVSAQGTVCAYSNVHMLCTDRIRVYELLANNDHMSKAYANCVGF